MGEEVPGYHLEDKHSVHREKMAGTMVQIQDNNIADRQKQNYFTLIRRLSSNGTTKTDQTTAPGGDVEDDDGDEQVGVCEASPEPFQLFQRHNESLKEAEEPGRQWCGAVCHREDQGKPSWTSGPSSTSPSPQSTPCPGGSLLGRHP
ncbi:uncharacterized protein LOC119330644 [Triticum dicoccoides]|uniref:uncharacterized protein LOC119330644 n=1 Tax=Triticum dicoccoides TaxID=85692 RepID=UPI00188FBE7E|nr:uncharacterized protein LOC119330644 [Triticum dicoccoides]